MKKYVCPQHGGLQVYRPPWHAGHKITVRTNAIFIRRKSVFNDAADNKQQLFIVMTRSISRCNPRTASNRLSANKALTWCQCRWVADVHHYAGRSRARTHDAQVSMTCRTLNAPIVMRATLIIFLKIIMSKSEQHINEHEHGLGEIEVSYTQCTSHR